MKIVHLVAGAGEMYCGSCLHGSTLAAALHQAGQDVVLAPVYTPLRTDGPNLSRPRVLFGGINAYLQQQSALFRLTPWFFDRLLDNPRLLRWLGRRAGSTNPRRLGPLTVSMLRGEQGRQRKELDKLTAWLEREVRPDVVHLSNAMLVGIARQLGQRLGAAIVCTLSGEDGFLDELIEPHRTEARAELRARCAELDGLVAVSDYYARFMAEYLALPQERIDVIPPGLDLQGYELEQDQQSQPGPADTDASARGPVTIGFFSRICPEKGLHLLAEAFRLLVERADLPPVRLRAAGYLGPSDRAYLQQIRERFVQWGLDDRFEYVGELDRRQKIAFLKSLDVLSIPTVRPESKGLAALEALAAGVPVVLPEHGAFCEWVTQTGGGLLCAPNDPAALAEALGRLILDPKTATHHGRQAATAVHANHSSQRMAERTIELYQRLRPAR
ncbi:MAG: glycosyltransferase family 4 protein [Pirellulales bacterium]|nr:glycosyltransferase family 4 protein [Pirellulales bacterium]